MRLVHEIHPGGGWQSDKIRAPLFSCFPFCLHVGLFRLSETVGYLRFRDSHPSPLTGILYLVKAILSGGFRPCTVH